MTKKKESDGIEQPSSRRSSLIKKTTLTVIILQVVAIVLLLMNYQMLSSLSENLQKEPFIDAGEGIIFEASTITPISTDYEITVTLTNTGDAKAMVSISGEAYISEMGSATGDEATTILNYQHVEILPGEKQNIDLGKLTAFNDWHYFIKVHVSWNGGAIELAEMLIPMP